MITISVCMIVKNEERVLERCLDSLRGLMDELIIVDTGSADRTKEIAARYTDKIYDFAWVGDFSAARNFAFSKASCEYIYSADADEVIGEKNRESFLRLKETLLPEIEIVQMYYGNQLSHGTIYNFDRELRPKLFKSEIEITHLPEKNHADRDLAAFRKLTEGGKTLSERLFGIYVRELFISGKESDFAAAEEFFTRAADGDLSMDQMKEALCVVVKAARLRGDYLKMNRYAMNDIASEGVSEVCYELGEYYLGAGLYDEAAMWFYNAVHEAGSILKIRCSGDLALIGLAKSYEKLGLAQQAREYRVKAIAWKADAGD